MKCKNILYMACLLLLLIMISACGIVPSGTTNMDQASGAQTFLVSTDNGKEIIMAPGRALSETEANQLKSDAICCNALGYDCYFQKGHEDYACLIGINTREEPNFLDGEYMLFVYEGFEDGTEYSLADDMQVFGFSRADDIASLTIFAYSDDGEEGQVYYSGEDEQISKRLYEILMKGTWEADLTDVEQDAESTTNQENEERMNIIFHLKNGNDYSVRFDPALNWFEWYYGNAVVLIEESEGEWICNLCQ